MLCNNLVDQIVSHTNFYLLHQYFIFIYILSPQICAICLLICCLHLLNDYLFKLNWYQIFRWELLRCVVWICRLDSHPVILPCSRIVNFYWEIHQSLFTISVFSFSRLIFCFILSSPRCYPKRCSQSDGCTRFNNLSRQKSFTGLSSWISQTISFTSFTVIFQTKHLGNMSRVLIGCFVLFCCVSRNIGLRNTYLTPHLMVRVSDSFIITIFIVCRWW